jgi:hypothetical protein
MNFSDKNIKRNNNNINSISNESTTGPGTKKK